MPFNSALCAMTKKNAHLLIHILLLVWLILSPALWQYNLSQIGGTSFLLLFHPLIPIYLLGFFAACVSMSLLTFKWFPASAIFLLSSVLVLWVVPKSIMADGYILNSLILGIFVLNAKAHNKTLKFAPLRSAGRRSATPLT